MDIRHGQMSVMVVSAIGRLVLRGAINRLSAYRQRREEMTGCMAGIR